MTAWRILFMGTPDFAVPVLTALLKGPDQLIALFTQPDKPTGRGMTIRSSPVKQSVAHLQIPIFQPPSLKNPDLITTITELQPDLVVVVAYGQILPAAILALPRFGCLNVHASLLPRWRGAAPIHRALLAGDQHSGVSIMQMDSGLDTGPVLAMEACPITPTMTGGELHDTLSLLGAELLIKTIADLKAGTIQPAVQPLEGVTYATKLTRDDEKIDFNLTALQVQRQILALNPWPGAVAFLHDKPLKILNGRLFNAHGVAGTIVAIHEDGPVVACGEGSVIITEVQPAGKRRMAARAWMQGRSLAVGLQLT